MSRFIQSFFIVLFSLQFFIVKFSASGNNKDSLEIIQLHNRVIDYSYSNPDTSKYLGRIALKKSIKLKDSYLISRSYNILGISYDINSQWDSALILYDLAIEKAKISKNLKVYASALNNKGLIYWNKTEGEKALPYYEKALKIFEEIGSQEGAANALNNIGLILRDLERYDESMMYQKKALVIRQTLMDTNGIGASYTNIGILLTETYQYDSARYYLSKAIEIKNNSTDNYGLAIAFTNLATTYKGLGILDSAELFYSKAVNIHKKLGNKLLEASNLSSLGSIYLEKDHLYEAKSILLEAEKLANSINNTKLLYGIQYRLGMVTYKLKEYKEAADFFNNSQKNQQQAYKVERDMEIEKINARYQAEKSEKEIAIQKAELERKELKLKNRNYLIFASILILALTLIFSFFSFRQLRFKNQLLLEENQLKDELADSKTQINVNNERIRISRDLHDNIGANLTFIISSIDNILFRLKHNNLSIEKNLENLSDFTRQTISQLRETIWAMNKKAINAEDFIGRLFQLREIANKSKGSSIVNILYDSEMDFSINAIQGIEIFRILQEAINNSFKHSQANKIDLHIVKENELIKFIISDDGIGFDLNSKSGNGLTNMKQRAASINARFNIESNAKYGTRIEIAFSEKD